MVVGRIGISPRGSVARLHADQGMARRIAVGILATLLASLDVALALTAIAPLLAPLFAGDLH